MRRSGGATARTINLDLGVINNAMGYAQTKGWVTKPPRLKKLKEEKPKKKQVVRIEHVQALLEACNESVTKNASPLKFYIRFLVLTGARKKASLLTRKIDVDLEGKKATIGADNDTKNNEYRLVDMSAELETLLRGMVTYSPQAPLSCSHLLNAERKTFRQVFCGNHSN